MGRVQKKKVTMDPMSNGVQAGAPSRVPAPKEEAGGEGNYEATRRYNEGLEKSVQKGNAEELAEEAKKALQGPEGNELREADALGKQGGGATQGGGKQGGDEQGGGANKPVSK